MKPEDRKRLKQHIEMIVEHKPTIEELQDTNRKLRLELQTLRFKESQENRFIWWIYSVYSRNVCDLIYAIMGATTYDTEGQAKEGKYALPKKCFDLMKRIDEYTEHIYDGTYLDVEMSANVKTSTDNNKLDSHTLEYAASWIENSLVGESDKRAIEFGKNMAMSLRAAKPSKPDFSVTQNVLMDIKTDQSIKNTDDYVEALEAELTALREQVRWIPVSERLPEERERVLFYGGFGGVVFVGYHTTQTPQWQSEDGSYFHGMNYRLVTHWRPLPQMPEVE